MRHTSMILALALLGGSAAAQQTQSAPETTPSTPAPASAAQTQPAVASLPPGTAVKMKLETLVSTVAARPGDRFAGRVTEDVVLNGKTVIPVGSGIEGRVAGVSAPRRVQGRPSIDLRPETVTMPSGEKFAISAVVVDTVGSKTTVDDEGKIHGDTLDKRDKIEMASGAAAGAIIGGLKNGAKGTFIGAAVGGGVAVVYWLTKHKNATLEPGTEIVMELSRPMVMSAASD
jgi:hypothetical protein